MGRPKVTIGIPVYNVEQYLIQCITSALNQDYENFEIIIVDDCSSDSSGYIADEYASKNEIMRVIHNTRNKKNSAARNTILREMTGEYIYWLDGDDYIESFTISACVDAMLKYDADIVKTAIFSRDAGYAGTYTREEYQRLLLPDKISSQIIGSLFKKELYTDIRHDETRNLPDYDTFPLLVDNAKRVAVLDNEGYHYRMMRPGSITEQTLGKFAGYSLRAYMTNKRYTKYKIEFPEESEIILGQFADYACMANLYAEDDDDVLPVRELMYANEKAVASADGINWFQKWLYRKVINHAGILPVVKFAYDIKKSIVKEELDRSEPQKDTKVIGKKKKK